MDIITALSGSGPAYFFLLMEAMQDVAEELGLKKEVAESLVYQTAIGASKLIREKQQKSALTNLEYEIEIVCKKNLINFSLIT